MSDRAIFSGKSSRSYLATGEPVGSRSISRLITLPLSPASVRNVMSDLEQLGLIYAPHTSAGRLPTELGLRFFVDALMQVGDLQRTGAAIDRGAARVRQQGAVGRSGAQRGDEPAVRPDPRRRRGADSKVQRHGSNTSNSCGWSPSRRWWCWSREDGQVENRVLALPPGVPASALIEASKFPQRPDSRPDTGGSPYRARKRAGAQPQPSSIN